MVHVYVCLWLDCFYGEACLNSNIGGLSLHLVLTCLNNRRPSAGSFVLSSHYHSCSQDQQYQEPKTKTMTGKWNTKLIRLTHFCLPVCNGNKAIVVIRLRSRCTIAPLTVYNSEFLNLSPMNAKLTSLSYHPTSMHLSIFLSPQTFIVTIVTIATPTCDSVILPINRRISLFLF